MGRVEYGAHEVHDIKTNRGVYIPFIKIKAGDDFVEFRATGSWKTEDAAKAFIVGA